MDSVHTVHLYGRMIHGTCNSMDDTVHTMYIIQKKVRLMLTSHAQCPRMAWDKYHGLTQCPWMA
jgi:hypothetical protein